MKRVFMLFKYLRILSSHNDKTVTGSDKGSLSPLSPMRTRPINCDHLSAEESFQENLHLQLLSGLVARTQPLTGQKENTMAEAEGSLSAVLNPASLGGFYLLEG